MPFSLALRFGDGVCTSKFIGILTPDIMLFFKKKRIFIICYVTKKIKIIIIYYDVQNADYFNLAMSTTGNFHFTQRHANKTDIDFTINHMIFTHSINTVLKYN
ncbi:hypothetical protein DDT52_03825 [Brenneria roseae subsp. roseae]|nr:hypothetical protein DDT52_03825 [Brenneria roseae subsp. roseae]